jgi:hypothetical protein
VIAASARRMRKKVSWTGWKKQLKLYVTPVSKVRAAEVHGENGKEENEDKRQHPVGDLGGTEAPSSREGLKSDDAIQRGDQKLQAGTGIKSDDRQELAVAQLSLTFSSTLKPNSAAQTSPPALSNSAATTTHGSAAGVKKGAFRKHVYRSSSGVSVWKFSSRASRSAGANDIALVAGARRRPAAADGAPRASKSAAGEQETTAAKRIQAAFRGYRSRRGYSSEADAWSASEGKELRQGKTQAAASRSTQQQYNLQTAAAAAAAADKLNINGEWDTDTRSPADLEAIEQYKQEAILKRERQREYALSLRRLRYGLEQKQGAARTRDGVPAAHAVDDDAMKNLLDKPGYVLNWLERAQEGGSRDNNLPSDQILAVPNTAKILPDGSSEKKKSRESKPKNGGRRRLSLGNEVEEEEEEEGRPSAGGGGKKVTRTMNDNRRKSVGSTTSPAATAAMILQATADRKLSSPFTAGMNLKAPIPSGNPKKLPFKI